MFSNSTNQPLNYLEKTHDPKNREIAYKRASESERLPLGIFLAEEGRPTFHESIGVFQDDDTPLFKRRLDRDRLRALIGTYGGGVSKRGIGMDELHETRA